MICKNCQTDIGDSAVCPHCHTRNIFETMPHHLPNGTIIDGKYTILGVLGEGGFGITYLGRNNRLEHIVAIKEFYPHGVSYRNTSSGNEIYLSPEIDEAHFLHGKECFLREAKTLAKFINEPGVVSVTDFVEANNTAYLIMEYLDGVTLREYLREHGRTDPMDTFLMLMPIISALEKIHNTGIIHRDISPDNIMILRNGQLKLMDFGSARGYMESVRSMSVILKKGYAPEEQYHRYGEQGPWTDVYGLCATIYRCITGETPVEALERINHDTLEKPTDLDIDIPFELENILMYGLSVFKENRCQDMAELRRLLFYAAQYTILRHDPKTYAAEAELISESRDSAANNGWSDGKTPKKDASPVMKPPTPVMKPAVTPKPQNPVMKPAVAPKPQNPVMKPAVAPKPQNPVMKPAVAQKVAEPVMKPAVAPKPQTPVMKPAVAPKPQTPVMKPAVAQKVPEPVMKPAVAQKVAEPVMKPAVAQRVPEPAAKMPHEAPIEMPAIPQEAFLNREPEPQQPNTYADHYTDYPVVTEAKAFRSNRSMSNKKLILIVVAVTIVVYIAIMLFLCFVYPGFVRSDSSSSANTSLCQPYAVMLSGDAHSADTLF